MAYNLQKLLDEIIEEYGLNKGYKKPNVCWSEFNRLCTYGEYQYWLNKIEISKFLDNDLVGKDTLKLLWRNIQKLFHCRVLNLGI